MPPTSPLKSTPKSLSPRQQLSAFWKFSRPHTIIGTSCSVLGIYCLVVALAAMAQILPSAANSLAWAAVGKFLGESSRSNFVNLGLSWLACLAGNVYIVGLNQLTDVAIDRINKPHLPIAAGEFTWIQGQRIVITGGLLALLIAAFQGPYLLAMVTASLAIGTAYSLPPVRLKRFPFWAALCIFGVRGVVVNLGLFLHFQSWFNTAPSLPLEIWVLTAFVIVFTFAIAIFKDIPDMEGDRQYQISTFTLKLGAKAVFNLARWVLMTCYLGMLLIILTRQVRVQVALGVISHCLLLGLLVWRSLQVDLEQKSAIAQFYQFIWKLFFLEYFVFPIACLLAVI
jgi:homogentisate phytyltransferase / homogentisate geranylgeranyltransferase